MIRILPILLLLILANLSMKAQSISGTVVSENQEPIGNAIISIQHDLNSSITDEDGFFDQNIGARSNFTLLVMAIGYSTLEISGLSTEHGDLALGKIILKPLSRTLQNLTIKALRHSQQSPFAFQTIYEDQIRNVNRGKDVPYLLNQVPSLVSSSDGGTGIGYTTMWIRGSDASRINVTINGVPYNDSESSGTFWVDLPDFASSVQSIQVQRGLGTSSQGAGAFGATVNLNTISDKTDTYAHFSQSLGSYNTSKSTIKFGTGLINDTWNFEGRLSSIKSDGYVDRASADLKSYYLQASLIRPKYQLDFVNFSGKEITYQAWYGVPQARIEGDSPGIENHIVNNGLSESEAQNLRNSDRRYNFYTYDDQVDDYKQDHYQVHFNAELNNSIRTSLVGHYTKGKGFFEEFRPDDSFSNYGLDDPIIEGLPVSTADIVRRRWLDNDFLGLIANVELKLQDGLSLVNGIAFNTYRGLHFGEIINSSIREGFDFDHRYYENTGDKSDFNLFSKLKLDLSSNFILFSDIQYRRISYQIAGNDNDLLDHDIEKSFDFFNPKLGISFNLNPANRFYLSYGIGRKEPNRNDFIDAVNNNIPKAEQMNDLELGFQREKSNYGIGINAYYMIYKNQLVLTGALNDVGSPIRENIDDSYRIGAEISGSYKPANSVLFKGNISLSKNQIKNFTETIYDYTNGFEILENEFTNTNISFSPSITAQSSLLYTIKDLDLEWSANYVGKRFLDNTSNENRVLNSYFKSDARISYHLTRHNSWKASIDFSIYNLFDAEYVSNGYTFSYIFGDMITENFYYPQAKRHFIASISIDF